MTREDMPKESYETLLRNIMDILVKNGLKATTMSYIGSALKMSKRTLYEIFETKSRMVQEVMTFHNREMLEKGREIFSKSPNLIEGILRCFKVYRDFMITVNVNFFRDLDILFAEARQNAAESRRMYIKELVRLLEKGRDEGLFRNDMNYLIQIKMHSIQMESLKRMESLFPRDIWLIDVYDSINLSFLRGISTPKGFDLIEKSVAKFHDEFYEEDLRHIREFQESLKQSDTQ